MKQLIFGLGSGCCGLQSLYALLNHQPDIDIKLGINIEKNLHILPWIYNEKRLINTLDIVSKSTDKITGEIASYYLRYSERILEIYPKSKFICLTKNKKSTIKSFFIKTKGKNYWTSEYSEYWDKNDIANDRAIIYPKYDLPKLKAIAKYWKEYYSIAFKLHDKYPKNFRIFDMYYTLNTTNGQKKVLNFVGLEESKMKINIGITQLARV